MPASAIDAPITLRNPRRETESTHSEAPLGNSRCSASWNSALPASSSRLRQYSGPEALAISARTEARSSLPLLEGQTSSPVFFVLCSSIIYIYFFCRWYRLSPWVMRLFSAAISRHHYRWHVLQLVISSTERTLYFFANAVPN